MLAIEVPGYSRRRVFLLRGFLKLGLPTPKFAMPVRTVSNFYILVATAEVHIAFSAGYEGLECGKVCLF
jgi:hypothetical protein